MIKPNRTSSEFSHLLQQLLRISGLAHDIGKATKLFQTKLRYPKSIQKDPVRHEWVSMKVLEGILKGRSLEESFESLTEKSIETTPFPFQGIQSVEHVILFVVATHHTMIVSDKSYRLDSKGFVRTVEGHPYHESPKEHLELQKGLYQELEFEIRTLYDDVKKLCKCNDRQYLRALALLARAFLIGADHTVSSRKMQEKNALLFANSIKVNAEIGKNKRVLNQDLNYHLKQVGELAVELATGSLHYEWPGLDVDTVEAICAASPAHYAWQNQAYDALLEIRKTSSAPALVFNVAGTGTGKTRMNAKAACALNTRSQVRFASALNLRTLTLQTGSVYRKELSIREDQMAVVIGDYVIQKLQQVSTSLGQKTTNHGDSVAEVDVDENPDERVFEADCDPDYSPSWMTEYLNLNRRSGALITQPVLVSTIDYLIGAGEPHRQGHHVSALARVANSDLILDEIDDYDSEAFVAVLRLVEMAAFHGANVITSSATLPFPMAKQLSIVFASGTKMRSLLLGGGGTFIGAVIDHLQAPLVQEYADSEALSESYESFIKTSMPLSAGLYHKIPRLVCFAPAPDAFFNAILASVQDLHSIFNWSYGSSGKQISVGLIRVANIYVAMKLCRFLSEELSDAYVAGYHSLDFVIQRYRKEQIMDEILNRKGQDPNERFESHPYIQQLVQNSHAQSIKFIIVATPVEEVGRDHDFDWGILEPSSVRSLVQAGGRVNRHRRFRVTEPNVHILQWNYKHCEGRKTAFNYPGYEDENNPWPCHDLNTLINWSEQEELTAALRFEEHPMTVLEDEAIQKKLEKPIKNLILEIASSQWMTDWFYRAYPLRKARRSIDLLLRDDRFFVIARGVLGIVESPSNDRVDRKPPAANHWLAWTIEELTEECVARGIKPEEGLRLTVDVYEDFHLKWDQSFGFERLKPA